MLLFDIPCNAQQQDLITASESLFLSPKEQANFHFMQHMRNILKSPDFMEDFETRLLKQKFADYQRLNPNFAELDYQQSYIKMPTFASEDIDTERFQNMLANPRTLPIVIKGLTSDTQAVKTWDHDYLMKTFGEVEVVSLEYDEVGSAQQSQAGDNDKQSMEEILKAQIEGDKDNSFYICNSAQLFNEYPHLYDEIGGDKLKTLFKDHSVNTFSQLFVGNDKTWGTNWHQGNDISCALMINGKKRWYFFDPRLVYILRSYLNGPNGMQTKAEVRYSLAYQLINNPLYAYAPKYYIDLEPGDALIFTKYWPHAITNLTPLQIMATARLTEVDMEQFAKGNQSANLLPVLDNVLNSDPDFIKFKFEIFQGLGNNQKIVGDDQYFAGIAKTRSS